MENFNKQFEEWKQKHQQKKDMEYLGAVAIPKMTLTLETEHFLGNWGE